MWFEATYRFKINLEESKLISVRGLDKVKELLSKQW